VSINNYSWGSETQFIGRGEVLQRLETWWESSELEGINLHGRRRVGKSWLFNKLAHGKPAVILVADKSLPTLQYSRLSDQLEAYLPFRPSITDITGLLKTIYDLGRAQKVLVVVDEFPNLLGSTEAEQSATLSVVATAMGLHQAGSQTKLILCGSAISQMERWQDSSSHLHGRFHPLQLKPLTFKEAEDYFEGEDVLDHLTRYSITGGMPRYLALLGKGELTDLIANKVLHPDAPLFDEVRNLLSYELREPTVYLSILSELASNAKDRGSIAQALNKTSDWLGTYLDRLEAIRMLERKHPVGSDRDGNVTQYECVDGFVRFWFKFVAPFTYHLEGGASPAAIVEEFIAPLLADHTAVEFEHILQRWTRQNYTKTRDVRSWWGKAANKHRRTGVRTTEEIDAVGVALKKVIVVGEAKWTNSLLSHDVLNDLINFKLPALADAGFTSVETCDIILASRSGFTQSLIDSANKDSRIRLISAEDLLFQVN